MPRKLIFGSSAAKRWFPNFRNPKDIDYISLENVMTEKEQHYWAPSFQYILDNNKDSEYVDANFLFTVKLSHLGWDIHWLKTRDDILFLKKRGCEVDVNLYRSLVKDWTKIHGKKHAGLAGKDSKTFFEDAVKRKYVHDSIHEAIAIYDKPLYTQILKDPKSNSVACSKEKFEALTLEDKLLLVLEETWVTALERFLIPNDFCYSKRLAFSQALKKMATTMSSGWMREFVHFEFDNLYYYSNMETFLNKFELAENQNKLQKL